jgi:putative ABC transport system ATP-binding protein
VLKGIDLQIDTGEMVAIMGASGSGKSTLLNILGCLDVPSSGKYYLKEREVSRLSRQELARVRSLQIGFIFQQFNLLPQLSALANVELGMQYSVGVDRKLALEALDKVGLTDRVHHRPRELSGGEQQRVAIARTLAKMPPLILADEPTGNLDSKSGIEIMSILTNLHQDHDVTLVMITHDADIAEYCQRTIRVKMIGIGKSTMKENLLSNENRFKGAYRILRGRTGKRQ